MQKVAIITGASSGIGAATGRRLPKDGMRVVLAARRGDLLAQLAAEIAASGGQALAVPTDVRDHAAIDRLAQATLDAWGRIDVLINNAGLGYARRVAELDPEELREQIDVNLVGVIECSQAVLPAMMRQKAGHIINVASLAGFIGLPTSSVYSATKFGVIGFSDGLRREVRRYGIHVTALCPGFVATGFSPRLREIGEEGPDRTRRPGVMSADYVADRIAGLIRHPRRQLIIPAGWGVLAWVGRAFPWLTDAVLARFLK